MRRVQILGCSGSGKSTLACRLGEVTGLPVIHLDAEYWKPGWVETPEDEFARRIEQLAAGERWIIDGWHRTSLGLRLRLADTIVYLDFPRRTCLWRVTRRWLRHRGRTRPDMGPQCPEKIDLEFLNYIWTFNSHVRPRVMDAIRAQAAGKPVHFLRSPADVERFVASASTDRCS